MKEPSFYFPTRVGISMIHRPDGAKSHASLGTDCCYFGTSVNCEGHFVSDTTDFTIYPGETVFIPKGCIYTSEWKGKPEAVFYSLFFNLSYDFQNDTQFSLQKVTVCDTDIPAIMPELLSCQENAPLKFLSKFYDLCGCVFPHLSKIPGKSFESSISKAIQYLEKHSDNDFDIPYLAGLCNMSQSYFYSTFKKSTGLTPVDYKNRIRCLRACELLRNSDYSVEYISEKLGFSTTSYFRKVLAHFTEKSPREIRKKKYDIM